MSVVLSFLLQTTSYQYAVECFNPYSFFLRMQMASFIGRLGTSKTLAAAAVGGAALAGAYYYSGGTTLNAGAAPGESI